jgi:hypothetical protein
MTYAWEAAGRFKSGRVSLKIEIARYGSESGGFTAGGLLVLAAKEVDELVILWTCMTVLNERGAIYMPGLCLASHD